MLLLVVLNEALIRNFYLAQFWLLIYVSRHLGYLNSVLLFIFNLLLAVENLLAVLCILIEYVLLIWLAN